VDERNEEKVHGADVVAEVPHDLGLTPDPKLRGQALPSRLRLLPRQQLRKPGSQRDLHVPR